MSTAQEKALQLAHAMKSIVTDRHNDDIPLGHSSMIEWLDLMIGFLSPAPAPVDLENFTISELCDLIEEARTVARAKQRKMQAACYCHRSPPCHYCVEGGHDDIP